jgi:hypothetical protein
MLTRERCRGKRDFAVVSGKSDSVEALPVESSCVSLLLQVVMQIRSGPDASEGERARGFFENAFQPQARHLDGPS